MKFPNKCCRCGVCCLIETCPVAREFYKIEKYDSCPALSFSNTEEAKCNLVRYGLIPVGDGCCIAARGFKDGKKYDIASLLDNMKYNIARNMRNKSGIRVVCAWCKKSMYIKEGYIKTTTGVSGVSHSICPDCYKKVKKEINND